MPQPAPDETGLVELLRDPLLAAAAAVLVAVSITWIVVWRVVIARMRRSGAVARRRHSRDIWRFPP